MRLKLIGLGVVLCVVGLAMWVLSFRGVVHTNWIPLSAPVSLVSSFSLRTNWYVGTPGRYLVYLAFDSKTLDLRDDTPEDTFDHPRQIAAEVKLLVTSPRGTLLDTNLTKAVLGSEGAERVSYLLGAFDLKQQDQVMISFSNTPSTNSVRTGNPHLEMRLSAATYADRLIAEAVGRRRGIPLAAFGLVLLIIGVLLPANRMRNDTA